MLICFCFAFICFYPLHPCECFCFLFAFNSKLKTQNSTLNIKMYQTITLSLDHKIAMVTLNRPEVHNAFNDVVLSELLAVFTELASNKEVRAVILAGNGKSFCAGADLNWMKKMKDYTYEENFADAMVLAKAMHAIYSLPQPTIARVNGSAFGGGMGLICACDMAIAAEGAKFSLSEVRLGLVPACIAPYVIRKIGVGRARQYFITGERMDTAKALEIGLVNQVVPLEGLDAAVEAQITHLLQCGPLAIAMAKELLDKVPGMSWDEAQRFNADMIARLRIGAEAQEGCAAFLEKRTPNW